MKRNDLQIRLTEEEKDIIRKKAEKYTPNGNMSQYAKKLLLSGEPTLIKNVDRRLLHDIKMQIRYIGNNINQAVRIMNMYHDTEEWNTVYQEFLHLKKYVEDKLK